MIVRLTWPAEPHTRYAQSAFDAQIGRKIKLNVGPDPGGVRVPAILLSAKVDNAGSGVEFEFDVTDPAACVILSAYVATGAVNNITIDDDANRVDKP